MALKALSNYAEKKLLDHLLGTTSWTMPTDVYLALFTSNPGPGGTGNEVGAGVGYARQVVAFNAAVATDSTPPHDPGGDGNGPALATNDGDVDFGPCTTTNWGTITHIGLYDDSAAGNLLVYGEVATSKLIEVGDSLTVFAENLKIRID